MTKDEKVKCNHSSKYPVAMSDEEDFIVYYCDDCQIWFWGNSSSLKKMSNLNEFRLGELAKKRYLKNQRYFKQNAVLGERKRIIKVIEEWDRKFTMDYAENIGKEGSVVIDCADIHHWFKLKIRDLRLEIENFNQMGGK